MTISENATNHHASGNLFLTLSGQHSRRRLLKGAVVGTTGIAAGAAGLGMLSVLPAQARTPVHPQNNTCLDQLQTIFDIAATGEQLAVTFYKNGVDHHDQLGLQDANLAFLQAVVVVEQLHQQFFVGLGGKPATDLFSFPHGAQTFEQLDLFIDTLMQLEGIFVSALLAAIREFAELQRPDLAQIAGELVAVQDEHRAVGRYIGGLRPASNWAFAPAQLSSVGAAPGALEADGFLSPKDGNRFQYQPVSTQDAGVLFTQPFAVPCS